MMRITFVLGFVLSVGVPAERFGNSRKSVKELLGKQCAPESMDGRGTESRPDEFHRQCPDDLRVG